MGLSERRMKRWWFSGILGVALVVGIGCQRAASPAPAATGVTNALPQLHLNHAQPRLPTLSLWVGAHELTAEVARRPVEIATGMMFRTNLVENEGMLFVFSRPSQVAFYMRNTLVPLSAAYIGPDGAILEIHDLQPRDETPVPATSDRVQYVLEVNQGWFQRHGISPGAVLRTPYGGLHEVDWRTLRPPGRQ